MPPPPPTPPPAPDADDAAVLRRRVAADPLLAPYGTNLQRRIDAARALRRRLAGDGSLADFATGHERFGVTRDGDGWLVREWAPNAESVHLKGPFSEWRERPEFAFARGDGGVFELRLSPGMMQHGVEHGLAVRWPGGRGDRLPAYARRVVQEPKTGSWNAIVWQPDEPYRWQHQTPRLDGPLLVYETHVGMAQEAAKVGTFAEFREHVLPRVVAAGYNALQIMGLAEHPYYGSFGYQVSSFFACSSRFGTPEELMALIDAAHGAGLVVLMDLVHSHCARNDVEGISRQDGGPAYVHPGQRGEHVAWGSRCFDYDKREVLEFLLSNCRFWLEHYRVDGFRFDGVTSMLYTHHGLGRKFTSYGEYFGAAVDEHALAYLTLANELIHELRPAAITIAEDVSGMPGLGVPIADGGHGFDYRFAMGVADEWTRLVKDVTDEKWSLERLWYELTNRRRDERSIGYAESHDQALVGDQTLMFRLVGARMYDHMSVAAQDLAVDRGIALHKLVRLVTFGTAGHGYLNFMGNEFGHPDWIDFPREGNSFSHAYARRQWSLVDDPSLRYRQLAAFDRAMLALAREFGVPGGDDEFLLRNDDKKKVLAWLRGDLVFACNFHPERSYARCEVPAAAGSYRVVLDTDDEAFGGHGRQDSATVHETFADRIQRHFVHLYLPARTGVVLRKN